MAWGVEMTIPAETWTHAPGRAWRAIGVARLRLARRGA